MELKDLKKTLFGYDEDSVYYYVVNLEAEIKEKFQKQYKIILEENEMLKSELNKIKSELATLQKQSNESTFDHLSFFKHK